MTEPLTEAQKVALLALADKRVASYFTKPLGTSDATLAALAHRGLVETQERPLTTVAKITRAGRAALAASESEGV